jgi:hypothetical protein
MPSSASRALVTSPMKGSMTAQATIYTPPPADGLVPPGDYMVPRADYDS